MGRLVVIDGLDGSGKTTQLARLDGYLADQGIHYKQISFPDYRNPSSALVKLYLDGVLMQPLRFMRWIGSRVSNSFGSRIMKREH